MKKIFHTVYGIGAAVILAGAVLEFSGETFCGISGSQALTTGLIVEACVFLIAAFDYSGIPIDNKKAGYSWRLQKIKNNEDKK